MRRTQFLVAACTAVVTFIALQTFVGSRYYGEYGWNRWNHWRGANGYHRHHRWNDDYRRYDERPRGDRDDSSWNAK